MTCSLFRAVSPEELADIGVVNGFRPIPRSLQGKWFAEAVADADTWGQRLFGQDPFHVVQVDIPNDVADLMFRLPWLDRIGPARYAEGDVLAIINSSHQGIVKIR